jgi:hypothetical protein
VPCSG